MKHNKTTIKNIIEQKVASEVKNLPKTVHLIIENALLSIVGIEKKYNGDYEIDHCNGRSSLLIKAFEQMAIDEAEKIASGFKLEPKQLVIYKKAFHDEFNRRLSYAIQDAAGKKAQEIAKDLAEKAKIDVDKLLAQELVKSIDF